MFQLEKATQVTCTNANPRRELHGKELVRAIDLTFSLTGENTLLDVIAPGLREHHYVNHALQARQEPLPIGPVPLPNLRFPKLPTENIAWKEIPTRGYRFIWDWGREAEHVDLTDAALTGIKYTLQEGGSVSVSFTVQYNGDELENNELYGELCGLASMGEVHIQLLPPPELMAVKKGYRAGKPDTQQPQVKDPNQGELAGTDDGGGAAFQGSADTEADVVHPDGSPEAALVASEAAKEKGKRGGRGKAVH